MFGVDPGSSCSSSEGRAQVFCLDDGTGERDLGHSDTCVGSTGKQLNVQSLVASVGTLPGPATRLTPVEDRLNGLGAVLLHAPKARPVWVNTGGVVIVPPDGWADHSIEVAAEKQQ